MRTLARIERLIFDTSLPCLLAVIAALMLVKIGVWVIPNIGVSRMVAINPFVNPFEDPLAHYLMTNWLSNLLAWGLHAKSDGKYILLHAAAAVGFWGVMVTLLKQELPHRPFRTALVIFTALPVSGTAFFWIGMDGLTLLLMALALLARRSTGPLLLCGVLLGLQHFEQALFFAGAMLLSALLQRRSAAPVGLPIRPAALLLAGTIAGKLLLMLIFHWAGVQMNSGRIFWMMKHLDLMIGQLLYHPHVVVFSVLGLGWLVAFAYADQSRGRLAFFLPLGLLLLLLPISGDQTRVMAIITFGLVATHWLLNGDFLEDISQTQTAALGLIWAITPWSWVWGGVPRWSAFPYDVGLVLHRLFGWITLPAQPLMWPFQ